MNDSDFYHIKDNSVQNFSRINVKKLFFEKALFDISLVAKNGVIFGHKIILASVSSYIKLFLTSELTSKNVSSIDLSTYEVDILKELLEFIYTGEIKLNEKNILDLVELVDFLGLSVLRHHLTYYLISTLNDINCWSYHEIAERHSYHEVFYKSDRYIRTHFTKLISGKKPEFLNSSPTQLISFFNGDFLGISDHKLLLISLCEWMGCAPEERLIYLESLLSKADIARVPSWRGMAEILSACFPLTHQALIKEWTEINGEKRDTIEKKPQLKESLLEVVFLIGGTIDGELVPSTDVFIPPLILVRVLPKSTDHKQLSIIPLMHERRTKPTVVSTMSSVYVIGGVKSHEELRARGIPCEAYRIKFNKWHLLPSLPQNENIKISTNRRPPAAFSGGSLYAALPSPIPSVWILSKNETCWEQCPSPNCYEIFDLVAVNGALYCIGREYEESACYILEWYDSFSQYWYSISVFNLSSTVPQVKGLCIDNKLVVTSGEQWLRFNPHKCDWEKCELAVSCGEVLPSLCAYKDKKIVSLRFQDEGPSTPFLELVSSNGSSEYYLPGRSSAAIASVFVPVTKPEPI